MSVTVVVDNELWLTVTLCHNAYKDAFSLECGKGRARGETNRCIAFSDCKAGRDWIVTALESYYQGRSSATHIQLGYYSCHYECTLSYSGSCWKEVQEKVEENAGKLVRMCAYTLH